MRRYETFVIFDPDLSEEERSPVVDRIKETINKQDGFLVEVDDWGARKLAYEIKKKNRGYYSRLDYCGAGPLVNELERFFRIDDRVLKYMTVLLEEEVDLDRIKEEIAQAEAEKVQPQPEPADEGADAVAPSEETSAPESPGSGKPASETPAVPEAEAAETETETPESGSESAEATKEG
jgi:small subunit ribosomal protein S6